MVFKAPKPKEISFEKIFFWLCGFKTILVRRRTKTKKYEGALFEQLESGWAYHSQLKTKQNRKQDNKTRHKDENKVNK